MSGVSLVNSLTGESLTLPELLSQLRTVERGITRLDDAIAAYSANLKAAKQDREKAIAELRSITREVKVLEASERRRGKKAARKTPPAES